ncbi:unnamed protein product, partial [Prorocentrum cordatum]
PFWLKGSGSSRLWVPAVSGRDPRARKAPSLRRRFASCTMIRLAIATVALLLGERGCAFLDDLFEYESTTVVGERRLETTTSEDPEIPVPSEYIHISPGCV